MATQAADYPVEETINMPSTEAVNAQDVAHVENAIDDLHPIYYGKDNNEKLPSLQHYPNGDNDTQLHQHRHHHDENDASPVVIEGNAEAELRSAEEQGTAQVIDTQHISPELEYVPNKEHEAVSEKKEENEEVEKTENSGEGSVACAETEDESSHDKVVNVKDSEEAAKLYEQMKAAVAEADAAVAEAREADLAERRQLCSEIIALRKELAIVKEDEQETREKLIATRRIIADHDPAIAKDLSELEKDAAESRLAEIWKDESELHNPDKMDWSQVDITHLAERIAKVREEYASIIARGDAYYEELGEKINTNTDYRENVKLEMKDAYEQEMEGAAPARARLRQELSEKKFHRKRGTGNRGVIAKDVQEKAVESRQRRVNQAEGQTGAEVEKLEEELDDLTEECKVLKSRLDYMRKLSSKKMNELESTLNTIQNDGSEVRAVKNRLLKEQEELYSLKTDLQEVLHYVRKMNKMEFDQI